MIGEITNAILNEIKALLSSTGAQVILKTNFQPKKLPDNNGNLVLLDIQAAPDSVQYPGGLTRMDWSWGLNSYNWEPDAYVDDETDYSTSLLNFIDTIRQHFSRSLPGALQISGDTNLWLTESMTNIFDVYGFQFTLTGVTNADALDQDGLIMGFRIGFDSTAFDNSTLFVNDNVSLQTASQVNNPPFGPNQPIS